MSQKNIKEQEIVYGIHPILEILKAKRRKVYSVYTTKIRTPEAFSSISALLAPYTQVQYVERERLTKMAESGEHQGVVAFVEPYQYRKKPFNKETEPVLLLLDGIQDPRNLGAIIRTAACTGVHGIIIPTKGAAPLTGSVYKASAGLTERVAIMQCNSTAQMIEKLQNAGYFTYLTMIEGKSIQEITFQKPLCLVIGNEGTGISKSLYPLGTHVSLPQKSSDVSFNASVAAGIFMFYIMNQ